MKTLGGQSFSVHSVLQQFRLRVLSMLPILVSCLMLRVESTCSDLACIDELRMSTSAWMYIQRSLRQHTSGRQHRQWRCQPTQHNAHQATRARNTQGDRAFGRSAWSTSSFDTQGVVSSGASRTSRSAQHISTSSRSGSRCPRAHRGPQKGLSQCGRRSDTPARPPAKS